MASVTPPYPMSFQNLQAAYVRSSPYPVYPQVRLSQPPNQTHKREHSPPPQQLPKRQTPEFHVHLLSQQLSLILSVPSSNPDKLHSNIQGYFDMYFLKAGASALILDADASVGAPLGSLSVLELENGINNLLRGHFDVTVMKREGMLKVVVSYPGEARPKEGGWVQEAAKEGWMGWRELEEKEAEMLMERFGDSVHM